MLAICAFRDSLGIWVTQENEKGNKKVAFYRALGFCGRKYESPGVAHGVSHPICYSLAPSGLVEQIYDHLFVCGPHGYACRLLQIFHAEVVG